MGRRVVLLLLAVSAGPVASWALLAPHSFFEAFPGRGHEWVAADGPYNEHLVLDVGALYLALFALTLGALPRAQRARAQLVGVVWLVFSVPHLAQHAGRPTELAPVDRLLSMAALTAVVVLAAALCLPPCNRAGARVTKGGTTSST